MHDDMGIANVTTHEKIANIRQEIVSDCLLYI